MPDLQKKMDKIKSQNQFVEIIVAVIFAMAFYFLIDSLVENVIMPLICVFMNSKFDDLKITFNKGDLYDRQFVIYFGNFISKLLILILMLLCIWAFYKIYKRRQEKEESQNLSNPELSTGDLLHVEMRDLLKNLVEIKDFLEEKKEK